MSYRLVRTGLASLALLMPMACSDAQAPTDANFRKALEPIVKDAFCRTIDVDAMVAAGQDENAAIPIVVSPKPPGTYGAGEERAAIAGLDEFARTGLLVRTEADAMAKRRGVSEEPDRHRLVSYAPTPKGEPYFRSLEWRTKTNHGVSPAVCAARAELVEIVRWTDPAELMGRTMTRVTYRYRGIDPIVGAPGDLKVALARPKERTTTLVLNNDGWGIPE